MAAVGIVLVLGIGAGIFVLVTKVASSGPGSREPKIPPAIAAPPADPLPARSGQYTQLPAGCSLLSNETVQVLAPGDTTTREHAPSERTAGDVRFVTHSCSWETPNTRGDYIRFIEATVHIMVGDGTVKDITELHRAEVEGLGPNVLVPKVDGKRNLPNLGEDAVMIYGTGGETCRMARILMRSQNARIEVHFGGCDRQQGQILPFTPMSEDSMINGTLTMARDVLQHLVSS